MIQVNLILPLNFRDEDIISALAEKLKRELQADFPFTLLRASLETSGKEELRYKAKVGITLDEKSERILLQKKDFYPCPELSFTVEKKKLDFRPVVVGSGPAGLFAALILAEAGVNPIVLERGDDIDTRKKKVDSFFSGGALCPESNIQFGEGGAGTFSDGKLKCGTLDKYKKKILDEFILAGAPEDIAYRTDAHIGTDILHTVIKNLRQKLVSLGAEVIFGAKVCDILIKNSKIYTVKYQKDNSINELYTEKVILATGHSAHDIFELLKSKSIPMQPRPFGVGARIEHPQELINKLVFKENVSLISESASYHLVTHLKNGRNVYSFCMCPGGEVVAATSHENRVVTNGMSNRRRDGNNANAAFLVSVTPEDFGSDDVLSGIQFQKRLEEKAFSISNDYKSPTIRMEDFINGQSSTHFGEVFPTYARGTVFAKCEEYMPEFIYESLRCAIADFDAWMPGFYFPDALICGIETRSTSPIRILRGENGISPGLDGLYPCGEGAGYAGGIISSAADGMMSAIKLLNSL